MIKYEYMKIKIKNLRTPSAEIFHLNNWFEEIFDFLLPFKDSKMINRFTHKHADRLIANFFVTFGLAKWQQDFSPEVVQERSHSFIKQAKEKDWQVEILKSKFGWTSHFRMMKDQKIINFDGLPTPHFCQKIDGTLFDDKKSGKELGETASRFAKNLSGSGN